MKLNLSAAVFFAAAAVLGFAPSAGAVDGTIEINQAKVLANGGFPYAISASNSYRLTGNLTVPANTNAINVTTTNVTVDLNGFSIVGPGSPSGSSIGINAAGWGEVTVENGTVTGFSLGVQVGNSGIIRNIHADVNGRGIFGNNNSVIDGCTANDSAPTTSVPYGIQCTAGCRISGNTVNEIPVASGSVAILCNGGCIISGNTAIDDGVGIECTGRGCVITGNTVVDNSATGIITSDNTSGFGGNVLDNVTNHNGPTSMGNNVCTGVPC